MNAATIKLWRIPLIIGLLFILFGIVMLKNPLTSFYTLSIIIGSTLIASGIVEIFVFGKNRKHLNNWSFQVSGGIIDLLIGIILIANPKIILIVLTMLVSLWLIYKAIFIIKKAVELKNTANNKWLLLLILGILILVLTVLLILKPEIIGAALALWIAISFIIFGIYRVFLALQLKNNSKINL